VPWKVPGQKLNVPVDSTVFPAWGHKIEMKECTQNPEMFASLAIQIWKAGENPSFFL